MIRRFRSFWPQSAIYTIYNSIGFCHINYFALLVSKNFGCSFNKLDKVYCQLSAAVHRCSRSNLPSKKWHSLDYHIFLTRRVFISKVIRLAYAPCLRSTLTNRSICYNLRGNGTLARVNVNRGSTNKAFQNWAPKLWNNLPAEVTTCLKLHHFKEQLRLFLSNHLDHLDLD